MKNVLAAYVPAVLVAYSLASILATQTILSVVQSLGLDVDLGTRLVTIWGDLVGMLSSYLPLILLAFALGLPVAAGLARILPRHRALLFALAGFVAIVALHLIMKAVLGLSGIAATRTLAGLLAQGVAGAAGGYCYYLVSTALSRASNRAGKL